MRGSCSAGARRYIGRTPHLRHTAPPQRVRRHAGARAGQRVRPAARVAAAVVPARDVDLRGRRVRRGRCARPPTGWRCSATSAAPATPTRSPPSSATRSRFAPRRSCTTPRIPPEVMRDVMAFATAGRSPEERDEIVQMIQETAREWAVYNFSSGCEVADMLVQRLDFGPDVREALRFTFERWNGNGYPDPRAGRGDPARDARRAPEPRHGGDRPPVLAGPRPRGRPRSPRPHLRPGARRPVRRARTRLVRSARRDRAVGRRARPRARAAPRAVRRGARRRPDRRRRLHRPQVAVHGRAQPSLRASSRPTPPGCSGSPRKPSPRSAARRSCTTSGPPSCRTRSGTSPGRSRGRSSTGSSFTRC